MNKRVTNSDIMAAVLASQAEVGALRGDVGGVDKRLGELTVQIKGNGGKGVLQRQDDSEAAIKDINAWRGKRPYTCPATAKEVTRRTATIVGLVVGGLPALSLAGNLLLRPIISREMVETVQRELQSRPQP